METLNPERKCEQNPALPEPLGFGGRGITLFVQLQLQEALSERMK